jgi:hypothetical protein
VLSDRCFISNHPLVGLAYEIVEDLIYVNLTGLNTSPVNGVVFEYSLDGDLWMSITPTSPITATTPNQGVPMYFRAKVDYEGCPLRLTTSVLFDACNSNSVNLIEAVREVKPDNTVCATATIVIPEDISYELISFTVDIGDGPIPYTNDTEICDIENAIFSIEVAIGTCPPITQTIDVNGSQECPTAEDLGLECVDGFTFIRTGVLPLDIIEDKIYYQITEDPDAWPYLWEEWDEVQTIAALYIRARRVIRFCGECDDICTPIIYCERVCGEYEITCEDCTLYVDAEEPCEVTWAGPEGFVAEGFSTPVSIEGDYTATIYCPDTLCTIILTYFYEQAQAGEGVEGEDEIIIDDI